MDKKNIIITVLAVVLAAVVAGGGVYIWQQDDDSDETETSQRETSNQDTTNQQATDTNATNESTTQPQPDPETDPTPSVRDDETLITEAFANKYSREVSEVDLTINENTGNHASGVAKFVGDISGGWWLAAVVDDDWVIVADGNGVVECMDIADYSFPTSMVPECWDGTTMITR